MLRAVQQRRFHARIKSRRLSFETSRRAGLEFVCIFGHDEDGELLAKSDILESQLATSLEGRDESANKRRNHAGMVPADRRLIKFGARG